MEIPDIQESFLSEVHNSKELLQKELSVNQAEQLLLEKRILLMKGFINDLPSSDLQYSMLIGQVQMDQIELDELKGRALLIEQRISELA